MLTTNTSMEHRAEPREDTNMLIKFRALSGAETKEQFAVVLDINELGAALFTYTPVPIGTRVIIDGGGKIDALAEVISWASDKASDMVRMGVRFIEKKETIH